MEQLVPFSFDVYWETDAQHRFTCQEFFTDIADAPAPGSKIGKARRAVRHLDVLQCTHGHKERAAAILGLTRFQLYGIVGVRRLGFVIDRPRSGSPPFLVRAMRTATLPELCRNHRPPCAVIAISRGAHCSPSA